MNLKGIVAVSGQTGLFKALSKTRSGFVLQSLDGSKRRIVTGENAKVASLEEITIYGNSSDIKLADIFASIDKNKNSLPQDKTQEKDLREFFKSIEPDHNSSKVYLSDIKKIINWYKILSSLPLWQEVNSDEKEENKEGSKKSTDAYKKTKKQKKNENP